MFDSKLGEALVDYWLSVAQHREFALDQATLLPDHVHMLVRTTPKMSIQECALLLANNGQHFVGKYWGSRLIEAESINYGSLQHMLAVVVTYQQLY